jgi:hypothetical protein
MNDWSWDATDDSADRLGAGLFGRIKAELEPTEYLLWADRPVPPRAIRIPFVPAVFVAVIAGLSGFSLAAMFGLVGQAWLDRRMVIVSLGLAPAVLGGMIAAHLLSLVIRRWVKRRKLARLVYALTDHRAIVAHIDRRSGELTSSSLRPGEAVDTRRFENPDGSGDLYFLGGDREQWLPFGFFEVPQVNLVEALVRETLLDHDHDWWKFGVAGTS